MNHEKIQSTLLACLKEAGALLSKNLLERDITNLKTELSFATSTDLAAEKLIIKRILDNFPDHAILAEESAATGDSSYRWIIDPLDGTTSFAHTFPVCCVSIGLEIDGEMAFGGVFDPFRNELFYAEKGRGATLNGKPIGVSRNSSLSQSLLATGFPYDRREKMDQYLSIFKAFLMKVHDLRRGGSSALDFCYVACGRFDGYWECNLCEWDKAAGILILREAGGKATDFFGKALTLQSKQNLISNGLIHDEMLETMKPFQNIGKN